MIVVLVIVIIALIGYEASFEEEIIVIASFLALFAFFAFFRKRRLTTLPHTCRKTHRLKSSGFHIFPFIYHFFSIDIFPFLFAI